MQVKYTLGSGEVHTAVAQEATSGRHGRHDSGSRRGSSERSTTAKLTLRDGPDQSQHPHLTILREALAFGATATSEVIHVDGESVGRAAAVAWARLTILHSIGTTQRFDAL